jgi:hypothetical protein
MNVTVSGPKGIAHNVPLDVVVIALDAIAKHDPSFTATTVRGRETLGHNVCACPDGHSGTPTTYVDYAYGANGFTVYYCDGPA